MFHFNDWSMYIGEASLANVVACIDRWGMKIFLNSLLFHVGILCEMLNIGLVLRGILRYMKEIPINWKMKIHNLKLRERNWTKRGSVETSLKRTCLHLMSSKSRQVIYQVLVKWLLKLKDSFWSCILVCLQLKRYVPRSLWCVVASSFSEIWFEISPFSGAPWSKEEKCSSSDAAVCWGRKKRFVGLFKIIATWEGEAYIY